MFSKSNQVQGTAIAVALGVGIATTVIWYMIRKWSSIRKLPTKWEEVGTVTRLLIYPVKSAKGIAVNSAEVTKDGLAVGQLKDRSFMVVTEDHCMVTGRESSTLVTLKTEFKDSTLKLINLQGNSICVNINEVDRNNNIIRMMIRGDEVRGVDCGDPVAHWLSKILFYNKQKVRLLLYVKQSNFSRKARKHDFFKFPSMWEGDSTMYNDATSYNIATESSLVDLNSKLEKHVTFGRFRPPIVIGGTKAFEEDDWLYIKIGDKAIFHMSKPCERCTLTHIDPDTGIKDTSPIEALKKYRLIAHPEALAKQWSTRPIFSIQCGLDVTGDIKIGDRVFVHRYKPYWHVKGSPVK